MNAYFVNYYRDFSNTYSLRYCDASNKKAIADLLKNGFERITRNNAIALAIAERRRQKNDPNFSGFADSFIYEYGYEESGYFEKHIFETYFISKKAAKK